MSGYDGEGTIPRGSASDKLRRYMERVYGKDSWARFIGHGALLTAFNCFPTVAGCLLRARLYRLILGGAGGGCYLEKNLKFFRPGRLYIGERVFLGEGAFFDIARDEDAIRIGDDSHVSRNVTVRTRAGEIRVGRQVNIGSGTFIYSHGGVEIGDYCLVANNVEMLSADHRIDRVDTPIRFQGRTEDRIVIGEDVYLGTHSVILGGVRIGRGAVIGAGAVVTRDVPDFAVAVGVPARVVRMRGDK